MKRVRLVTATLWLPGWFSLGLPLWLSFAILTINPATGAEPVRRQPQYKVRIERNVGIPMRDSGMNISVTEVPTMENVATLESLRDASPH